MSRDETSKSQQEEIHAAVFSSAESTVRRNAQFNKQLVDFFEIDNSSKNFSPSDNFDDALLLWRKIIELEIFEWCSSGLIYENDAGKINFRFDIDIHDFQKMGEHYSESPAMAICITAKKIMENGIKSFE